MRFLPFFRVVNSLFLALALFVLSFFVPSSLFASYAYPSGTTGYDFSYPNCAQVLPLDGSWSVAGVTNGRSFTHNPCLAAEFATYGLEKTTLYMNLNAAIGSTANKATLGPKPCKKNDKACLNYNYGYQAAQDAYTYAQSQGATASMWWLDIETANSWNNDVAINQQVIQGAKDFFTSKSIESGIYSVSFMWQTITGGWKNSMPVWIAPVHADATTAPTFCSNTNSFTNGPVYLVQYPLNGSDADYACP